MPDTSHKSWYRIERNVAGSDEVYLYDEIGLWGIGAKDFTDELRALSQPVIKLHINSPGGSVDDGIAIFNALKSSGKRVEVYIDALAASIASVIAMAGDTVVMAPHARMMIHEAMAMGMGYAGDFEKLANRLRDTTRNIASIYTERAGQTDDYWLGLMADETWLSDQQAVDEGLADEIGRDYDRNQFKVAASFSLLSKFREQNAATEFLAIGEEPQVAALTEERVREIAAAAATEAIAALQSQAPKETNEDQHEELERMLASMPVPKRKAG